MSLGFKSVTSWTKAFSASQPAASGIPLARYCSSANCNGITILLDEPFAGVDPISVIDIKRIIKQLTERNIGVLITDHNVRETLDICDRAYIANEGEIIAEGTPSEVLANEHVKQVYLGDQFKL